MFRLTTVTRVLTVIVALACIALAITPPLPEARGEGAVSLAVIMPENTGHAPASTLDQIGQAMYDGAVASGHYEVKGGGPIKVEPASTGDVFAAALGAASRANADQVLVSDVIKIGDGKLIYRMTIYKVNPVTFGRSQVFTQQFPPSDPRVLATQFGGNLTTLEAPRTYTGTIYSLAPTTADTGSAEGFHLGQRFNVVRGGKKVAEAQIVALGDISATVDILNPSAGYQAQVGDLLISQEQGPAIPVSTTNSGGNGVISILAVLVGVGAGLAAINHSSSAAAVQCPGPTPSGPSCSTSSPGGSFTVSLTSQTGAPNQPTLVFTFSKPVVNAASFPFSGTTELYMQSKIGVSGSLGPQTPIFGFGAASTSFDATGQVLTIATTAPLTVGDIYFIVFTNLITATDGSTLSLTSFQYPSSGVCCAAAVRPASRGVVPVNAGGSGPKGNGSGPKGNGNQAPPAPSKPVVPGGANSSH